MTPAEELRDAVMTLREEGLRSLEVVEPLAAWLESWDGVNMSEHGPHPDDWRHALAVARVINGGAS